MRKRSLILGVTVVIAGTLLLAHSIFRDRGSHPVYRIGFSDSPPLLLAHPDGSPGGLAYDVLTSAAARAGLRLDWRLSRKLNHEFLGEGSADLWPLADPENSGGFGVTRPWARGSFAMLWLAEARRGEMLVAVNKSARTLSLLAKHSPAAARREADGAVEAMSAMCSGAATHAFMDARVAQRLLLARPAACAGKHLRMETALDAELPLGIMYRPGYEDAAQTLRRAVDEMALDGSLADAFARWSTAAYSSVEHGRILAESQARANRIRWTSITVSVLLGATVMVAILLRRARNLALETAAAKSNFAAIVSHELRTPLNGFLGMAELLANSPLNPEQRELAETLRASAQSFQGVVNDILEFSRIEAGKLHIECAPCDLSVIAAEAAAALERRAKAKGLEIRVIPDKTLGDVMADGAKLRQVLINLLDNAVKFTHEGSVAVRIRAEAPEESGRRISLEVSDTGIGIEPAKAAELFSPFRQAHESQSRRFGGLGLGLSICKGFVEAMKGDIGISSQKGLGTTVTVRLILEPAPAALGGVPGTGAIGKLRVLVVDDSKANRLVATRILQKLGHETEEAANGREAVEMALSREYAIIVMDCQMPEMDGIEAARKIRAQSTGGRRVPIVALTASVEPADQRLCFEAGMDGFLQKPISLEGMRQMLMKFACS